MKTIDRDRILKNSIEEMKKMRKVIEDSCKLQKFESNVFSSINKRYIEMGKLINEYEKNQLS